MARKGSYLGGSTVEGWGSHGYRAISKNLKAVPASSQPAKPVSAKLRKGGPSTLEIKHFSFGGKSLDRVLDDLEPAVWTLQKRGVEHPDDVARLLNAAGIKTALGSEWTPQLALFLLGFIHKRRQGYPSERQRPPKAQALTLEERGFRLRGPKLIPRSD